jgi:bifunctional UDP-N-acetylglucosamine pyrophosphorylase/glucosamine-1-phosphate N-acetyltransferase
MAAGQGTRMLSSVPKVLHEVCGRPMVAWPILAAREAGAERVCVIVSPASKVPAGLPGGVETVVQEHPDGTGGAIRAASELISGSDTVLVLSGDHPLISAAVLGELIAAQSGQGAGAAVLTTELDDPGTYGRVVRAADDSFERIVEAKKEGDATPEQLRIREVNAGTYAFAAGSLQKALGGLNNDNAQGEYYLPDVLPLIREAGELVVAHKVADRSVNLGVNDRVQLSIVNEKARQTILEEHMRAGVTIVDPASTVIDADVEIAADTTVHPFTSLLGDTRIGGGCTVGPLTTLIDVTLGADVHIPHSYATECEVRDGASVGPFAYLRPGTLLRERSKAGTFVEIKNSDVGEGAKVPHLSYIGDADVGAGTNLGASTITANYDGRRKHRTTIGEGVHGGVHTSLVAPVTVGDDAWIGAGSVITDEVPEGALGIARARQRNLEGYDERLKEHADR